MIDTTLKKNMQNILQYLCKKDAKNTKKYVIKISIDETPVFKHQFLPRSRTGRKVRKLF